MAATLIILLDRPLVAGMSLQSFRNSKVVLHALAVVLDVLIWETALHPITWDTFGMSVPQ